MDEELDRLKRLVDLTELAGSFGYQLEPRARARGVRTSVTMEHPVTDHKIVVGRHTDGHWIYYSVRGGDDQGSVVDFLRARRSLNLGAVRKELRAWLGEDRPRTPIVRVEPAAAEPIAGAAVIRTYAAARAVDSRYLLGRALHRETLRAPRFADTFRVDARGNVLFAHRNPTGRVVGYEIKNRTFTSFATGGHKTAWMSASRLDDLRLVIVEGAIDALSYHQVFPDPHTRYLSTGGAVGPKQLAVVAGAIAAMPRDAEIIIATDADAGGERLFAQISPLADPTRLRRHASPVPKDWNDYLQALERKRRFRAPFHLER